MFIRRLHVAPFKPFSALTVTIDESPRLVMACGMNGSGKSSFIDAISLWRQQQHWGISDPAYYARGGTSTSPQGGAVELEFHGEQPADRRVAVNVRTAQRVTVDFNIGSIGQPEDLLTDPGPRRTIDLDTRVEQNYRRLMAESVRRLWDRTNPQMSDEIIETLVGSIAEPLGRLLPGFVFEGPSIDPLANGTFEFTKGTAQRYAYKLLSGGEKAVFDLLIDFAVKISTFTNTVYCVDEPELHVNAAIHGALLDEMLALLPSGCQLVLATHSAGMLARARALANAEPGSVAFLDFDSCDFESPVDLRPSVPDRAFWRRQLSIAFGGFADLLAPSRVVLCEGSPSTKNTARASFDAHCYNAIFGDQMPDTTFMSVGSSEDVEHDRLQLSDRITALVDGVEIIRLIDRDAKSESEIADARASGLRVLRHRNLECYLLADDVLYALCATYGRPDRAPTLQLARDEALAYAVEERNVAVDDLKMARNETITAARRILAAAQGGNTTDRFLRDTVAPLLGPGMKTYDELREDVFGSTAANAAAQGGSLASA
jgi:hypothetical protein